MADQSDWGRRQVCLTIPRFDLKFYVSNLRGDCAGVALFQNPEARFAVCDANGPRLEPMDGLSPLEEGA